MDNSTINRDKIHRRYKGIPDKLMVKKNGKIFFLDISEINWIESAGNYIKVVTSKDYYLVRNTMKNIENELDGNVFFRTHRSTIINIGKIKFIEPWFHGDYQIVMEDGVKLIMSRNYTRILETF